MLAFAIVCASGVLVTLNTYGTELFPTDMRADAFAWSNNLIGRISYVLSRLFVGSWRARLDSATRFDRLR